MDGHILNLSKKMVRYKEHLRLYSTCEEKKLIPNGLHKKAPMAFEDEELQDICQKIYDFASVLCQKQRTKYLNREIHKMQKELQNLKEIKWRESGYENSERLLADIREKCNRLKETMQRTHERKM